MRVLKKVLLILLPVVITLFILELLLRLIGAYYVYSLGNLYRDDKATGEKKITILAVGESTTGGLWYESESYPIQLKNKMNEYYGCDNCVAVQILALPGASTSSTLRAYLSELYTVKPDIVLFMVGVNDGTYYSYNFDAILLRKDYQGNELVHRFDRALIQLSNQSKLAKLIKLAYTRMTVPQEVINDDAYIYSQLDKSDLWKREHFASVYYEESKITTAQNIESLVKITRGTDAIPILMTYHQAHVNELIRSVAEKTNSALIDNEKVFTVRGDSTLISDRDNWHPTAEGYALIAENVFAFLVDQELISK